MLADTPVTGPARDVTGRHVYYMYSILAPRRDELAAYLAERGIRTQVIYPRLVQDQVAYQGLPWRAVGDLPVARSLVPQLLDLPMFAELTDDEVERVASTVRAFYAVG